MRMDPTLRHILNQWLGNNTIVHDYLNTEGITTVEQFKQMLSDPNTVNSIKNKTGPTEVDIDNNLKEILSEVLSYMNQLQLNIDIGPIMQVGVYDFRLKAQGDFEMWYNAALPFVHYDETKAKRIYRRRIRHQQELKHIEQHGTYALYLFDENLDDDYDVPGMELCKPSSRDDNTDDISTPISASDYSSNQSPTAEKSIFSTTTTNHNFAFTDTCSNYDNMNHLLFSYALNVIAVPCLTVAKQTFDTQSKLFDRGILSVASPSSLAAAKHFFDEQSKLFDRGNPSTVLILTLLGKFGLVRGETQCTFNCLREQIQRRVRKHLKGYPFGILLLELEDFPLLSTSCFHAPTIRLKVTYLDLGSCVHILRGNCWTML